MKVSVPKYNKNLIIYNWRIKILMVEHYLKVNSCSNLGAPVDTPKIKLSY